MRVCLWVFWCCIEGIIYTWENVSRFTCVRAWMKLQSRLFARVWGTVCALKKSSLLKVCISTQGGSVRSTAKLCEKASNARWRVQMCRSSIYMCQRLESYTDRDSHTHKNTYFNHWLYPMMGNQLFFLLLYKSEAKSPWWVLDITLRTFLEPGFAVGSWSSCFIPATLPQTETQIKEGVFWLVF